MYRHNTSFIGVMRRCSRLGIAALLFMILTLGIATVGSSALSVAGGNIQGATVFAQTPSAPLNPGQYDPKYQTCKDGQCLIRDYVQPTLNLLAALVGVAVTISFISAGIRYASSADSPQKVSEAKQRMVTSVFVLIGFFTFYALMNYLIPGGVI